MEQKTVKFRDWNCVVVKREYDNGRPALQLIDAEDGSPIARATVNLPDVELGPNQVIVKSYSENEGMLEALVAADVALPVRMIRTGFVEVPVCELMPPYREHAAAVKESKGRGRTR